MIKINSKVIREQTNFWNHCLFHPTDAIEDSWGKRILDKMAEDGAVKTVRIYAMLEDIVYLDENDELQYDFRASDLRLDYMLEKGYDLIISYAGMPDCISSSTEFKSCESKNSTRYKGKLFNTSMPKDLAVWEEVCYQYTKHNIERYGIDVVSRWHCHCFNEPDVPGFFLREFSEDPKYTDIRVTEFCKLFEAFLRGITRASDRIPVGGPAIANDDAFFAKFLDHVKEKNLRLDYVAFHNYGTSPFEINQRGGRITVKNNMKRYYDFTKMINDRGFDKCELICDEWGASSHGYYNVEECPAFMFRENEIYSAYYARFIYELLKINTPLSKMLICLSGQHEMVTDFSGFRNFFTLNFIRKPIYNTYVLASKLKPLLLTAQTDNDNIFVIPTKDENGEFSVLISYSSEYFEENLPSVEKNVEFEDDVKEKTVTVWCIDKNTTNPYRKAEKLGIGKAPTKEEIAIMREEGRLKPVAVQSGSEKLSLRLTANSVYLVEVK